MERKKEKRDYSLCQFFEKTGTCTCGESDSLCGFHHIQRFMSRCLVFHHLYPNAEYVNAFLPPEKRIELDPYQNRKFSDAFFLDNFLEFSQFGKVEDMYICSNITKHLYGNVYVRFAEIDAAVACHEALEGRFYAGRKVTSTFLPSDRLSYTLCKNNVDGKCVHGDMCPFPHRIVITKTILFECFPKQEQTTPAELIPIKTVPFFDDPNNVVRGKTMFFKLNQDPETKRRREKEANLTYIPDRIE